MLLDKRKQLKCFNKLIFLNALKLVVLWFVFKLAVLTLAQDLIYSIYLEVPLMLADNSKVSKTPQLELLPTTKSWFSYILLNYFCHQNILKHQICFVRLGMQKEQ